jgi:hypothetical protein
MRKLNKLSESTLKRYNKKQLVNHIKRTMRLHNNKLFEVRPYQYIRDGIDAFFIWDKRCNAYVHYSDVDACKFDLTVIIEMLYEDIENNS